MGLSVCLSVGRNNEPYKMVESIEMLFGVWTWVGPGNHVLGGGSDPPARKGQFRVISRPVVICEV